MHASATATALGLALLLGAQLALAQTVEVYTPRGRSANELLPLAEAAIADGGRVVADPGSNRLILAGEPEAVARTRALLESLDVPRRSVVLRYASTTTSSLDAQGIDVRWSVRKGGVRVGNVTRRRGRSQVDIQLDAREERRRSRVAGQLRIAEGEAGRISTGVAVPVTTRTLERGPFGTVVRESTQTVSAETGFEARPRILGDGRIEIALRPFSGELTPEGNVTFREADTVVLVEPGETVAIGGLTRTADRGSAGLSGTDQSERSEEELMLLTAEIH